MPASSIAPFLAHIERCRNVNLPGLYRPFYCGAARIGWLLPETIAALAHIDARPLVIRPDGEAGVARGDDMQALGEVMATAGLYAPHNELFDVFDPQDRAIGRIDRGALPLLGLEARGVHMNGLVRRADGLHLWMGHRALTKRLDPGMLDHLVAGGISAGLTPLETLIKEADEEAGIPRELAARAIHAGTVRYTMARPEGLRRDTLLCFDLELPETFVPHPNDGEVDHFELMPIETVFALVRDTERLKFNVNLVLIDLFLRLDFFAQDEARTLRQALTAPQVAA